MARFMITEATVSEVKFNAVAKAYQIAFELTRGVTISCLCPFEHTLKVGDKLYLQIDIPLVLEQVKQ